MQLFDAALIKRLSAVSLLFFCLLWQPYLAVTPWLLALSPIFSGLVGYSSSPFGQILTFRQMQLLNGLTVGFLAYLSLVTGRACANLYELGHTAGSAGLNAHRPLVVLTACLLIILGVCLVQVISLGRTMLRQRSRLKPTTFRLAGPSPSDLAASLGCAPLHPELSAASTSALNTFEHGGHVVTCDPIPPVGSQASDINLWFMTTAEVLDGPAQANLLASVQRTLALQTASVDLDRVESVATATRRFRQSTGVLVAVNACLLLECMYIACGLFG